MSDERTVPGTLDLADHGRMAINGVLGSCDPDCDYENYFLTFFDVHPAYMVHFGSQVSGVLPEYVEALPLLRLMSGSDHYADIEAGLMESVLANAADDGLIYDRVQAKRPWNTGVGYGVKGWDEDYANIAGNADLLTGFLYLYHATGDETWNRHAERTAERMLSLALTKMITRTTRTSGWGTILAIPGYRVGRTERNRRASSRARRAR